MNTYFATANSTTGPLTIRALGPEDGEALRGWAKSKCTELGLGAKNLADIDARPARDFQAELSQDQWTFFGALEQGRLVALGRITPDPTADYSVEISNVEVAASHAASGLHAQMYGTIARHLSTRYSGMGALARIDVRDTASRDAAEKVGLKYSGRSTGGHAGTPMYMYYRISAKDLASVTVGQRHPF